MFGSRSSVRQKMSNPFWGNGVIFSEKTTFFKRRIAERIHSMPIDASTRVYAVRGLFFILLGVLIGVAMEAGLGLSAVALDSELAKSVLQTESARAIQSRWQKSRESLGLMSIPDLKWKTEIEESIRQRNEEIRALQLEAELQRAPAGSGEGSSSSRLQNGHEIQSVTVN